MKKVILGEIDSGEYLPVGKTGSLVGAFHVKEKRDNKSCGDSVWVKEPVCYIIDCTMKIDDPIQCRGRLGCWKIPDEDRRNLITQLNKQEIRWNKMSTLHK